MHEASKHLKTTVSQINDFAAHQMLPAPVLSRSRSQWGSTPSSSPSRRLWTEFTLGNSGKLGQRSRATNLAVLLLASIAAISLLLNIRLYYDNAVRCFVFEWHPWRLL